MSTLTDALSTLAQSLPASTRKQVYKGVKIAAALATVVLVVLPLLPALGVSYDTTGLAAVLTAVLATVGHLADSNTHPEPLLDPSSAPETTP
jgi:hypothetical protein